jgi:hypothetical protein
MKWTILSLCAIATLATVEPLLTTTSPGNAESLSEFCDSHAYRRYFGGSGRREILS